jgi:WD40 repeat protein
MPWPHSQDYNEAIQNPGNSFADSDLRQGHAKTNALGLPVPCSGNFADVYQVGNGARVWAVKCFTREIPGLRDRYVEISAHLQTLQLPLLVAFKFLDQGIRVRGQWYPVLKMDWVEGFMLNSFVKQNLDKPAVLGKLAQLWVPLARALRQADLAHCDLQHGNVLLVPGSKAGALAIKLVDYDGMCVPSLTLLKSLELGHPAYQHPQRLRERLYGLKVDRFSHLVIYTALRALMVGGKGLWDKYDNGDNLLFKQADFEAPTRSRLLADLLRMSEREVHDLAGRLIDAARAPLDQTPQLDDLVPATVGPPSAPAIKLGPQGAMVPPAPSQSTLAHAKAGPAGAGKFPSNVVRRDTAIKGPQPIPTQPASQSQIIRLSSSTKTNLARQRARARVATVCCVFLLLAGTAVGGFLWWQSWSTDGSPGLPQLAKHESQQPSGRANDDGRTSPRAGNEDPGLKADPKVQTSREPEKQATPKTVPSPEPEIPPRPTVDPVPKIEPVPKVTPKKEPEPIAERKQPDPPPKTVPEPEDTPKTEPTPDPKPRPEPKPEPKVDVKRPAGKLRVPAGADQDKARKTIHELFETEFAMQEPGAMRELAGKLNGQAEETQDDPAARFVLYYEACHLMAKAGDLQEAGRVVQRIGRAYDIDPVKLQKDIFSAAGSSATTPEASKKYAETLLAFIDRAVAEDRYQEAAALLPVASASAKKSQNARLRTQVQAREKQLRNVEDDLEKLEAAKAVLKTSPEDPDANLVVGTFLALRMADWGKALPYLARGSDPKLKTAAEKDLAEPTDTAKQLAAAEAWWDLGQGKEDAAKALFQRRSHYWYTLALPGLKGLNHTKVERRLEGLEAKYPDLKVTALLHTFTGHGGTVVCVAFSADGRAIASGSTDGTARVWDTATGKETGRHEREDGPVTSIAFSDEGKTILTCHGPFEAAGGQKRWAACLWNAGTGTHLKSMRQPDTSPPAFARLLVASMDASVVLSITVHNLPGAGFLCHMQPQSWRGADDGPRQFAEPNVSVGSAVLSADGRAALTSPVAGRREPLRMWNLKTGKMRALSFVASGPQTLALSRDARHALSAGADKVIRLWDTSSGKELCRLTGHDGAVLALALSADGSRILSGSADKTLRLWDTRTGKELRRYTDHEGPVTCVAFSRDGRHALSGSADKTLRLWQLQRGVAKKLDENSPEPKGEEQPANRAIDRPAEGSFKKQDQLTETDPKDTVRRNMHAKKHTVHFKAGKTYQIDMVSGAIDPYLRLEDANGRQLAEDDDGGGFPNARIIFDCQQGGVYRIICTSFNPNETGPFTLTVREQ